MAPNRGQLMARVNFPPYAVHILTERHFLVAGGGGSAKTGIKNIIEIYEVINNGRSCRAESVMHYDTGREAIMNFAVFHNGKHFVLAAGMGGNCQIYQLKYKLLEHDQQNGDLDFGTSDCPRRRKRTSSKRASDPAILNGAIRHSSGSSAPPHQQGVGGGDANRPDTNANSIVNKIGFDVQPIEVFQTDFNINYEPFQKVVRITKDCSTMVTAGADGKIRLWKYPGLSLKKEIDAHTNEVDDLDINAIGDQMVSVSRDGHGYVWNVEDGSKRCELTFAPPKETGEKYIFKGCRFGIMEGDRKNSCLFTTINPFVHRKPPQPSYLMKWNTQRYALEKVVSTGTDLISTLAVSDDGRFLGLGTMCGNVDVYIAFSLQRIYHLSQAHNIFVTGLEFLPSSEEANRITGDNKDASLISISVDNHIIAHHIPRQSTVGLVGIVIFFIVFLFIIYVLLDYLNL